MRNRGITSFTRWASLATLILGLLVLAGCLRRNTLPDEQKPAPVLGTTPDKIGPVVHPEPDLPKRTPAATTCAKYGDFFALSAKEPGIGEAKAQKLRDSALKAYQQALEIDPKYVDAYRSLAQLYLDLNDTAHMAQTYQKALEIVPQDAGLWHEMGIALLRQKDAGALEALSKATTLDPVNREFSSSYGFALARAGQYDEALAVFLRHNDAATAHYNVARMQAHMQQPALSLVQVRLALAKNPNLTQAQQLKAELEGEGKPPELPANDPALALGWHVDPDPKARFADPMGMCGPGPMAKEEPRAKLRYQGKTFDQWSARLEIELEPNSRVEAINALIAFGVNGYAEEAAMILAKEATRFADVSDEAFKVRMAFAKMIYLGEPVVPILLDALESKDPTRMQFSRDVLNIDRDGKIAELPESGRRALNLEQPRLLRIARSKDYRTANLAIQLLRQTEMQNEGVAVLLLELLDSEYKEFRELALDTLPEGGDVVELGPQWRRSVVNGAGARREFVHPYVKLDARAAVPALIKLLDDADVTIRIKAAKRVSYYRAEAKQTVPMLIKCLKRADDSSYGPSKVDEIASYMLALGVIGPDAKDAVPIMKAMQNYYGAEEIRDIFLRIDPKAAQPLVPEPSLVPN